MRPVTRMAALGMALVLCGRWEHEPIPAEAAATRCEGVIGAVTVGSLTVPSGKHCTLLRTLVNGSVAVEPGGGLWVLGADIQGSLQAKNANFIAIANAREIGGGDQISVIIGSVIITGTRPGASGFLNANVICDATAIGGSLILAHNQAPFSIGNDTRNCSYPGKGAFDGAMIGGDVKITGNRIPREILPYGHIYDGTIAVLGNVIKGSLICAGNVPFPTIKDRHRVDAADDGSDPNRVRGATTGQCAGFASPH